MTLSTLWIISGFTTAVGVAGAEPVLARAYATDPRTLGELASPGCGCGRALVVESIGLNGPPTADT